MNPVPALPAQANSKSSSEIKLSIHVPSPSNFNNSALELHDHGYDIDIRLTHGNNTFMSADFEMGILKSYGGRLLNGRFSFSYSYDPVSRIVTVCGSDYPSARGMSLLTQPIASDEISIERATPSGFHADDGYGNRHWYHRAQLFAGTTEAFRTTCRQANEMLIEALQEWPDVHVTVLQTLPELSTDLYHDVCLLSRHGKPFGNLKPGHIYLPYHVVTLPESQVQGTHMFKVDEHFANVKGSTGDPKPTGYSNGSWTQIWEEFTEQSATICTTHDWPVPCTPGVFAGAARKGGHVIIGKEAEPVPDNGDCYMFPICQNHNKSTYTGPMRAREYQKALHLRDYRH
ncbi:MAG: hypothetical protein GOMPHAMPRED_004239 [Gomphillus americanus]|uniref:Uncharacterized protein n=1 Tax=Gomphillus americanus TaxID=1940652 RepID=A0A8H3FJ02_9LECA|nr:MAG: hypothetical protein GOMPHAMPRED_004239 [Gomphillus americanus]